MCRVSPHSCYLVSKERTSSVSVSCGCDVTAYSCLAVSDWSNSSTGSLQDLISCSPDKTRFDKIDYD